MVMMKWVETVTGKAACSPFSFETTNDLLWQAFNAVARRVRSEVLEHIYSENPKLVAAVLNQMTAAPCAATRQALALFCESTERIGSALLRGKDIPRIEYLFARLSNLFFAPGNSDNIRSKIPRAVLVLIDAYPFRNSLFTAFRTRTTTSDTFGCSLEQAKTSRQARATQ